MTHTQGESLPANVAGWTRRGFMAASGVAVMLGAAGRSRADTAANAQDQSATVEAIHFPQSFLHCSPTDYGIWVRVQAACRGRLVDLATGEADEYVMGVLAKTGLTLDPKTGERAPGYDYSIIFSKTHVFTKRSHTSSYFNNPTVLKHADFGSAEWRLRRVPATALTSPPQVRAALEGWKEMSATTAFTSADGTRQFVIEYPVKWADCMLNSEGFRVETGPVFLLDPDKLKVGEVPAFEDFQWAHVDFNSFDRVRLLLEEKTSILVDATFTPPHENSRENRENAALTQAQLEQLESLVFSGKNTPLPPDRMRALLSTDHYSAVKETAVQTQLYSLGV